MMSFAGDKKERRFTVGPKRRTWMTDPLLPADFIVAVPGHRESGLLFAAGRASRQVCSSSSEGIAAVPTALCS